MSTLIILQLIKSNNMFTALTYSVGYLYIYYISINRYLLMQYYMFPSLPLRLIYTLSYVSKTIA